MVTKADLDRYRELCDAPKAVHDSRLRDLMSTQLGPRLLAEVERLNILVEELRKQLRQT